MTTNTTGPAELRRLASAFPEELPQLSARSGALTAAWEADIARAERADAALERARALLGKLRDGLDDYWTFLNPEVVAELAAALSAPDGAR